MRVQDPAAHDSDQPSAAASRCQRPPPLGVTLLACVCAWIGGETRAALAEPPPADPQTQEQDSTAPPAPKPDPAPEEELPDQPADETPAEPPPADAAADTTTPAGERPPWEQPPKFLSLRYNEDFSYLEDHPEGRGDDPLMWLKNIDVGGAWRLDIGGETRLRAEKRLNPVFGLDEQHGIQQNYRHMLFANIHHGKLFRLFVQGIHAHVETQDEPFEPTQENHFDVHQLFADFRFLGEDVPLTLRVGRQEMYYGHDRLIGAFEWVSTRRRFDAVKLFYHTGTWDIDLFAARPVTVARTSIDDWNDDYNFYGLYNTFRLVPNHGVDLYLLHVDRSDQVTNPNGHTGGRSVSTAGTRFWGQTGPWDYEAEAAGQWGQWASDDVQATFLEVDLGYKFDHPWYPRLGTGFGWASGDDDPFDRFVGTWDQLFTYDHVCISFQDLIGRQNTTRYYVMLEAWPHYKVKTSIFYHLYWLNQETDFYYNAGGSPVLRDPFGHAGNELGSALEMMVEWQLTPHTSLMAVYSHFWDGSYFHSVVEDDDDPDFFFIQYQIRF